VEQAAASLERLERAVPPRAVVDPPPPRPRSRAIAVDPPEPGDVTSLVVAVGPLALEKRLGASVPELLMEVRAHRAASAVPDARTRAEADLRPRFLEAPADVDVVAGRYELGIESADVQQRLAPERHVAAWYVLRLLVRQQHVNGTARSMRHAVGDEPAVAWRDVRATDGGAVTPPKRRSQVRQPVLVGAGVVVQVRDDLAGCGRKTEIASRGEATLFVSDQPYVEP